MTLNVANDAESNCLLSRSIVKHNLVVCGECMVERNEHSFVLVAWAVVEFDYTNACCSAVVDSEKRKDLKVEMIK